MTREVLALDAACFQESSDLIHTYQTMLRLLQSRLKILQARPEFHPIIQRDLKALDLSQITFFKIFHIGSQKMFIFIQLKDFYLLTIFLDLPNRDIILSSNFQVNSALISIQHLKPRLQGISQNSQDSSLKSYQFYVVDQQSLSLINFEVLQQPQSQQQSQCLNKVLKSRVIKNERVGKGKITLASQLGSNNELCLLTDEEYVYRFDFLRQELIKEKEFNDDDDDGYGIYGRKKPLKEVVQILIEEQVEQGFQKELLGQKQDLGEGSKLRVNFVYLSDLVAQPKRVIYRYKIAEKLEFCQRANGSIFIHDQAEIIQINHQSLNQNQSQNQNIKELGDQYGFGEITNILSCKDDHNEESEKLLIEFQDKTLETYLFRYSLKLQSVKLISQKRLRFQIQADTVFELDQLQRIFVIGKINFQRFNYVYSPVTLLPSKDLSDQVSLQKSLSLGIPLFQDCFTSLTDLGLNRYLVISKSNKMVILEQRDQQPSQFIVKGIISLADSIKYKSFRSESNLRSMAVQSYKARTFVLIQQLSADSYSFFYNQRPTNQQGNQGQKLKLRLDYEHFLFDVETQQILPVALTYEKKAYTARNSQLENINTILDRFNRDRILNLREVDEAEDKELYSFMIKDFVMAEEDCFLFFDERNPLIVITYFNKETQNFKIVGLLCLQGRVNDFKYSSLNKTLTVSLNGYSTIIYNLTIKRSQKEDNQIIFAELEYFKSEQRGRHSVFSQLNEQTGLITGCDKLGHVYLSSTQLLEEKGTQKKLTKLDINSGRVSQFVQQSFKTVVSNESSFQFKDILSQIFYTNRVFHQQQPNEQDSQNQQNSIKKQKQNQQKNTLSFDRVFGRSEEHSQGVKEIHHYFQEEQKEGNDKKVSQQLMLSELFLLGRHGKVQAVGYRDLATERADNILNAIIAAFSQFLKHVFLKTELKDLQRDELLTVDIDLVEEFLRIKDLNAKKRIFQDFIGLLERNQEQRFGYEFDYFVQNLESLAFADN